MTQAGGRDPVLPLSTILQNRYRIIRLHDRGGSATVYLAERLGVDEHVPLAVKELNPDAFSLAEFKNEVNVLYSLNHPNLPKVYDFFEEDGKHYLVMDFVQGKTLKQRVLEGGPLSEDQALDYALQVCDIMSYLHERAERKIIHRDLKPSNLMLTRGGQIKLLDFGIARIPESQVPGNRLYAYTEDYASPEQKANLETDERSDVYSFGVTLRFLLTGVAPGTEAGEAGPPSEAKPPRRVGLSGEAKLSREVNRIVGRCLRLTPADRYQSFKDLARDIRAYRLAKRTRLTRTLWVAAAAIGLAAIFLAGKFILSPSLNPVVGPDRVEVRSSVALQVGLPAAWKGSLDSIVWQVYDTQAAESPRIVQRGRYLSFSSNELGVYQVQAFFEQDGRRRPLSEVKRIEVYPSLDAPKELLIGQPLTLWSRGASSGNGREYMWVWDVRGPVEGGNVAAAPSLAHQVTSEPRFELRVPLTGVYVAQVSATVKAPGGLDVTVSGDQKTFTAATELRVNPKRIVNENGSFENKFGGQPVGWVLVYPSHLVYDQTQAHTGSRSIRFTPSTGSQVSYAVQLVPLEAGKTYRVTVWARGENLAEGALVTLEARFRSSVDESYVMPGEEVSLGWKGTFDWRQMMLYFSLPPGKTANLEVYLTFSGSGTLWFDDCAVEALD